MAGLKVTRTVTFVTTVSEDSYPNMTLAEAAEYEKKLELDEVIELLYTTEDVELDTKVDISE